MLFYHAYHLKIKILVFILLSSMSSSLAQISSGTTSAYSRYGIGDLYSKGFVQNRSMGGIGIGIASPYSINIINPASYSSIKLTTFETAAFNNLVKTSTNTLEGITQSASVAYLAIAFPVTKRWGSSIGLVPYSSVGYDIFDEATFENIGDVEYFYEGSGGINQFYIGNALRIFKNFSLGFNASYLFGSINRVNRIEFPSSANTYNSRTQNITSIGDFHFEGGLQFNQSIRQDISLTIGVVGSISSQINADRTTIIERYSGIENFIFVKDTIQNMVEEGTLNLPQSLGIGFILKKNEKWLIGADYSVQDWSSFRAFEENDSLVNSTHASIGMQYIPDANSIKNYFYQIQYRMGLFYNQTYLQLKNTSLHEYGISLGLGFPVRKAQSVLSLGVEFGQRGTIENNLIREQYIKTTLGFTLNDKWFIKRKFD